MPADLVLAVLTAYPQVYHACHRRHSRARSNPARLSDRDAWILGHLHPTRPASPRRLAGHMSLRPSTVSEAIKRLERLGYVVRRPVPGDGRRVELLLAPRGAEAMPAGSNGCSRCCRPRGGPRRSKACPSWPTPPEPSNAREPKRWDDGAAS